MITRKTRALSIIATIAMLVSMLACFVIPASADDSWKAPYLAVLEDAVAGGAGDLQAALNDAAASESAVKAALSGVSLKEFSFEENPYPRYAYKEAYALAGYTAKEFSVAAAEDWLAMVEDSKTETFAGYKFHILNDIDFKNAKMAPLNYIQGAETNVNPDAISFRGTIEGHGNAFLNVNVYASATIATSAGLIGKLGTGADIKDFGVESGSIEVNGANYDQASTFGEMVGAAKLTRVWSGADIICNSGTKSGSHGIICHSQYSEGIVNGAYFYGTLITTGSDSDQRYLAIAGDNMRDMSIYNTLGAPIVSAEIENSKASACMKYTGSTKPNMANNYGVNIPADYANIGNANTSDMVTSALDGAYIINNSQPATGVEAIYFTLNEKGELRFGDASNRIVRITTSSNIGDSGMVYAAAGSKIKIKDLGLLVGKGTVATVDGGKVPVENQEFVVPSYDVAVTVEHDRETQIELYTAILQELVDKYETFEPSLYSDPDALNAFIADGKAAIANKDLDEIKLLISLESELDLEMVRYPTYSQYDEMKDQNTDNNWAISTKEDWLAMVADSAADTSITFEGFNFHLTNDIDFGGVAMKPLCYGGIFLGNINGHGYGFDNILIDASVIDTSKPYVGLISRMDSGRLENFGINSGAVDGSGLAHDGYIYVAGMIGYSDKTNNTKPLLIQKCWNGADVDSIVTSRQITAAALLCSGVNNITNNKYFVINGFLNTGDITNHSTFTGELYTAVIIAAACYHYHGGVLNSLNTGTVTGVAYSADALPNPGKGACFMRVNAGATPNIVNNASMGDLQLFYYSPTDPGKFPTYYNNLESVAAAAYKLNQGNSGLKDSQGNAVAPVYYTLKDGEIAFGADDGSDQVRKITFESKGVYIGEMYAAAGSTVKLACAEATGYDSIVSGNSSTLYASTGELDLGNEDVVVEILINNEEALRVQIGVVEGLLAKYEDIDVNEFANGEDITAWKAACQRAIDNADLNGLYAAEENEKALAAGLVLKEGFVPVYSKYDFYKDYNKDNKWAITTKEDWLAMVAASNADSTLTFRGYTFYLTNDIDFGSTQMSPLCDNVNAPFQGTLYGQGHAFKNINVLKNIAEPFNTGLIGKVGACVIDNFGVDSGIIDLKGNNYQSVSMFGTAKGAAKISRVWFGGTLKCTTWHGTTRGFLADTSQDSGAVLNGAYFYGTMTATTNTGSPYLTHDRLVFTGENSRGTYVYNSIGAPASSEGVDGVAKYNSLGEYATGGIQNTQAVGNFPFFCQMKVAMDVSLAPNSGFSSSVIEAAWKVNQNQVNGVERIYYTLKDGNVRFGTADNRICRVLVMDGERVVQTFYKLPGEQVTVEIPGVTEYAITQGSKSTLAGNVLTLGAEDVIVAAAPCAHENTTTSHIAGTKTHTVHCNDCGDDTVVNCTLGNKTANDDLVIAGGVITAGTHSSTCSVCGGVQTENCTGKIKYNATDCTVDGTFTFNCCDRADAAAIGSAKTEHTFNGNWTTAGAPAGKEIDKCADCDAKLYRTVGKVEFVGNMVAPGRQAALTITLPNALTAAALEVTTAEGANVSILSVTGDGTLGMDNCIVYGGTRFVADLSDVSAGAVLTVTVEADRFAFIEDGILNVKVTNATDAEGKVSDAIAQAEIALIRLAGDANADGTITIKDPLTVLQYLAGQNVDIHTVNADFNNSGAPDLTDAALIVQEWMKSI